MNRSLLLRNAVAAAAQILVQTIVFFVLYRYLVDRLGIEKVGIWSVVLATASAARITELGLGGSVTKFIAAARAQGDDRAAGQILQTAALTVAGVLAVLLPLLYPLLSALLRHVLPASASVEGQAMLPYALLSIWCGAVAGIWQGGLDGCLRTDIRAALMVAGTVAFMAAVFLTTPQYGLLGLAISQVAQGMLLVVAGWFAIRGSIRGLPVLPSVWSPARLREIFGYGANVQVIAVVMMLFEPVTKIFFARYAGLVSAGHFELAQQLVMKMRALIVESNRVIVPMMAGMAELGQDARRIYAVNIRYLILLLTPLFAALAAVLPLISVIWLGRFEAQFVTMAAWLTAGWFANSVTAPAYFAYLGQGRLRWLTISHLILGGSNAVLGLLLGPLLGWPGILAAFLISLAMGSFIPVWAYHREHSLSLRDVLSWPDVRLLTLSGVAAALAIAGTSMVLSRSAGLWAPAAMVALALAIMASGAWWHPLAADIVKGIRHRISRVDS